MAGFALSTGWHAPRVADARELLALPARLGFAAVELSSIGSDLAQALQGLVRDGLPPVVSLHAPCPVPYPGAERLDDLAALEEPRRLAAVGYTKESIDLAAVLGARVVVLHLGGVEGTVPQRTIVEAMAAGPEGEWKRLLADGLALRSAARDRHLEQCLRSLEAVAAHAAGSGIRLGAETRYHYNDLPDVEEFQMILDAYCARGVGYWHDTGHANTHETLGLTRPLEYLQRYGAHLVGVHLHDAVGTRDHLPPGEGEVDFAALRPFLRPEHLRVFEVWSGHSTERLAASLRVLQEAGV
jgi:sugar phosphate isomerase/epimerase